MLCCDRRDGLQVLSALNRAADRHWSPSIRGLANVVSSTIAVRTQVTIDGSYDESLFTHAQSLPSYARSRSPLCGLSAPGPASSTAIGNVRLALHLLPAMASPVQFLQ